MTEVLNRELHLLYIDFLKLRICGKLQKVCPGRQLLRPLILQTIQNCNLRSFSRRIAHSTDPLLQFYRQQADGTGALRLQIISKCSCQKQLLNLTGRYPSVFA